MSLFPRLRFVFAGLACVSATTWHCKDPLPQPSTPLAICKRDPRVALGLVPLRVCAGARVFFDEQFGGNGRSCGSCHPAANNYTLDRTEVRRLRKTQPSHPLFVAEDPQFDLGFLEDSELFGPFALIRENVDGLEDPAFKYVSRAVSHTLSLSTSIAADPADGTSSRIKERTGWGGDGAPDSGSLRDFANGAIAQHLTRDRERKAGRSFRYATESEKDQLLTFQLALGRIKDLDLTHVKLTDSRAAQGQGVFVDPMRGRCNHCHGNAGANAIHSGLNRNFGTFTRGPLLAIKQRDGSFLHDGGFGGKGLPQPNLVTMSGKPDAFGDGTFNTPSLIEAADTGPYFHAHIAGNDGTENIEAAVALYSSFLFARSPAAKNLEVLFGAPLKLEGLDTDNVGRFLRVLNAAFNLALVQQRLQAVNTLSRARQVNSQPIEKGLLQLASEELTDAYGVLTNAPGSDELHPEQQLEAEQIAHLIDMALRAPGPSERQIRLAQALATTKRAKQALGKGLDFELGSGNLMF